jgi:flagellar biosynthesis/type III secretory pathway M-ring protein FliF/YscJ
MGGMTSSQKLLIGCLGVILLMTLFLVSQYAGRPAMVELFPTGVATPEEQTRAVSFLRASDFEFKSGTGGRPLVRREEQKQIIAALSEAGQQPANSALLFENILKTQNWLNTKEQNRQIYTVMLRNELGGIISRFAGVKLANVNLDIPEPSGLGASARTPKAAVAIFMQGNKPVPQNTVDAAARLVAGSISGLELSRVTITDGATGHPCKVMQDDEMAPSTYREYAATVEKQFREKLLNLVSDIDGVVVEVTASVDVSKLRAQVTKTLPLNEGSLSVPKRESTTTSQETQPSRGAEPGVRSNQTASINEGSANPGARNEQKQEDTEFATQFGTRVEQIEDPRGMPTRLVATVGIPRSFIAAVLQREKAAPDAKVSDAEIEERFTKEELRLTKSLAPHVKTVTPTGEAIQGEVIVTLMSGEALAGVAGGRREPAEAEMAPGLGSLSTLLAAGGGMVDKIVLAALALVALGMMVMMVRKAGRHVAPPTTEELAGSPPTLATKDDLVGEADESETAMAGIIVGEDDLKATKLREQVSELIRQSPDTAVKVLNRWVTTEE